MKQFIAALAAIVFATGVATADETRVSIGYATADHELANIEFDGSAWYLLGEGDEGDFIYRLAFSKQSVEDATGNELEADVTDAYLGWHGLYWGEVGFGPAILHQRLDWSEATFAGMRIDLEGTNKTTFAGALMRTETDQFELSAALGVDAGSDSWDSGFGLLVDADIHVSDSFTVTAGWNRAWGELESGFDVREDAFSLGGRYRFADTFFVEGEAVRTNGEAVNVDYSSTTFKLGVGVTF